MEKDMLSLGRYKERNKEKAEHKDTEKKLEEAEKELKKTEEELAAMEKDMLSSGRYKERSKCPNGCQQKCPPGCVAEHSSALRGTAAIALFCGLLAFQF